MQSPEQNRPQDRVFPSARRMGTSMPMAAGTAASIKASFAQERAGLVALYNATAGEQWSDSSTNGWLHDACHCQWTGVRCLNESACDDSPVYGVVRQGGKGLVGTLPSLNGDPSEGGVCLL